MAQLLLIADDSAVVRFAVRALEADGHEAIHSDDGAKGLGLAVRYRPSLVILGIGLPGLSTNATLAALLAGDLHGGVLVLGSPTDVADNVQALDHSRTQFLPTPFPTASLLSLVRRRLIAEMQPRENAREVVSGDLRLELTTRRLFSSSRYVDLSQREAALMQHLMRHPGKACSRAELLAAVWGYAFDPGSNVVDVTIARLRSKLKDMRIETVRNVGYALQQA
jgi:DNA-binding response OmpR family regulator